MCQVALKKPDQVHLVGQSIGVSMMQGQIIQNCISVSCKIESNLCAIYCWDKLWLCLQWRAYTHLQGLLWLCMVWNPCKIFQYLPLHTISTEKAKCEPQCVSTVLKTVLEKCIEGQEPSLECYLPPVFFKKFRSHRMQAFSSCILTAAIQRLSFKINMTLFYKFWDDIGTARGWHYVEVAVQGIWEISPRKLCAN